MHYNNGYKSREYLTGRPDLTVLQERGKAYKQAAQIPAAKRRAEAAATMDLTATTIIKTNSLFDSTDELCQMSREVQRTRTATVTNDGRLVRRLPESTAVSPRGADMAISCCRQDLRYCRNADRQ